MSEDERREPVAMQGSADNRLLQLWSQTWLQTKGWTVSHGPGLHVGQHRGAPIPQGVQLFVASSQLQRLGECSLLPQQLQGPSPSTRSGRPLLQHEWCCCWGENPTNAQARQERKPTSPTGVPRRDGELSCLASYCAMHQGRGGCTSPSGNSSSCCPSPAPARGVFPALSRGQRCSTMAQEAVT